MLKRERRVLVERALTGSAEAIDRLFDHCWPVVWRTAYAVTGSRDAADDVALEALFQAFRSLGQFDPSRPLEPWLKRIALNVALKHVARDRRLADAEGRYQEMWAPDSVVENTHTVADATAALAGLPMARRLVVVLHYWLDMTLEQIADALEIPVGTATSRLSRALSDLRDVLEEEHVR